MKPPLCYQGSKDGDIAEVWRKTQYTFLNEKETKLLDSTR